MIRKYAGISTGLIFVVGLVIYIGDVYTVSAIIVPVIIHELFHVACIRLLGLRIRSLRAELRGLCIEYGGYTGAVGHAITAAAGPIGGLMYALAAAAAGERTGSQWLFLSGGVSLMLSLFNMLPALPLDGGRVLLSLTEALLGPKLAHSISSIISVIIGAVLLACGALAIMRGAGIAPALAGIWILAYQNEGRGLV